MAKAKDKSAQIVDAAMTVAAEKGWRDLSLADVAAAADIGLGDLYEHYRSKEAILDAFLERVDRQVLQGLGTELVDEPVRDRLFDLIMRRLDALEPHREAVRAILRDRSSDPLEMAAGGISLLRAMTLTLEAAGISTAGVSGLVRAQGLAAIYLSTLRTWLHDETEDKAHTMAALDRSLQRADRLMAGLCRLRGRRAVRRPQPETPPAGEAQTPPVG